MATWECSQYPKSDKGALNRIQDWQHLVFADLFWEMDCQAIDMQMAYLQENLLMPADYPELQWLVSKLLHIEYLSLDIIGQGLFVNTIASMNLFATSKFCFYQKGEHIE